MVVKIQIIIRGKPDRMIRYCFRRYTCITSFIPHRNSIGKTDYLSCIDEETCPGSSTQVIKLVHDLRQLVSKCVLLNFVYFGTNLRRDTIPDPRQFYKGNGQLKHQSFVIRLLSYQVYSRSLMNKLCFYLENVSEVVIWSQCL